MEPQITCDSESSAELWWMDQNSGIPLHVWNLESFLQIGDACGGYIDVARKTREQSDLIEASIRIKDNYSGDILIMSDDLHFNMTDFIQGLYSISIKISVPNGSISSAWWLSALYGSASRRNRNNFWSELEEFNIKSSLNWLLAGGFNVVRYTSETSAQNPGNYSMRKFNAFISNAT
ncbi:hypothetical protein E6C27_scaffold385G00290 [Cucumis melo var. makuwa]|uniref:DUF4283 domain-containing protein n=1 Tax=Cucumis melo var. makuwa TaxID=1194695 RepID=A0A5A7U3E5_CUCMM|nr:hypothetical protein E6C27_scaffold385G00290 [Cucumis melo var. makuwa]